MKICFLVSSMGAGGAERVAAMLSNAWVKRGDSVTLIVTYSNRGPCAYVLDSSVDLVYLADHVSSSQSGILNKFRRFAKLRKIISAGAPDVVISFLTNVNVAGILATRFSSFPIIVSERIYPPMFEIGRWLTIMRRLTYPFADMVVMQTTHGVKWLSTTIPKARGVVIANPIAFPLPSNLPIQLPKNAYSESRKLLLSVGRLEQQKQIDLVIKAFALIACKHLDWDLAIIGEGSKKGALVLLAESLNLGDRVRFFGQIGNVGDWFARAEIFVLCSQFEGFPNVLVEAMSYGCTAISYDCNTGPRDIIRDGLDGILMQPLNDVLDLSGVISNLMVDDITRARLSNNALSVRARFSLDRILANWDELFSNIKRQ